MLGVRYEQQMSGGLRTRLVQVIEPIRGSRASILVQGAGLLLPPRAAHGLSECHRHPRNLETIRVTVPGISRRIAARRDDRMLAKEARYSSERMTGRLADKDDEAEALLVTDAESEKARYLRRKRAQGTREFRDEQR